MPERGKINNRARAQQIKDFSGLVFGKITPTDIDGFIEYHDKLFIVIESKYKDKEMPFGQRLALERMVNALATVKPSILFLGTHDDPTESDIDFANIKVNKYFFKGEWKLWLKQSTLKDAILSFIKKYAGD